MTEKWEEKFNKIFCQDNDPKDGDILYLFRINADGSRSIALPRDVKNFISEALKDAVICYDKNLSLDSIGKAHREYYSFQEARQKELKKYGIEEKER